MALTLNEDWTAHVAGQMHKYRITNVELAGRCVYGVDKDGNKKTYSHQYVSTVMNGKKEFESDEAAQKTKECILSALDELIAERQKEIEDGSPDAESDGD